MTEKTNQTNDNFLTISDLLLECVARWRWFVASIGLCLLLAVRYILTAPYLYSRSASIMVHEDAVGSNATDKNSKDFTDIGFLKQKNNLVDIVRHITSLDVLMEVANRSGKCVEKSELLAIAEGIQGRLSVEAVGEKSNIINLSYKDSSTGGAERLLYLIIEVYNDKWMQNKREAIRSTSDFIDVKLRMLEDELNEVDDSIASYKSRYGITELTNVSNIYLKQQSETDAEILKLMNQKAMAEYIRSLLADEASQQQLLLVNSGINNTLIESQITLYNSLLLQMQSHMEYTSDQNPLIINLEKELNSLRKNILSNVVNHIRTIDIQLQSLDEYHSMTTSKIASNPKQAKHLMSIEREQKVKESLYLYLLQKKEENEISLTYRSVPTQIIDVPHGGGKPTSPKRMRILFSAIFLGGLIPFSTIFVCLILDETVRNKLDIERRDDIPFLGEVPFVKRRTNLRGRLHRLKQLILSPEGIPIVVYNGGKDPANEAFRVIRTRLDDANNAHPGQNVYMVTASKENVGKTFVAMNLAITLAISGKRVLFIDGDLRKGSASHLWKTPKQGLTDLLNGSTSNPGLMFFHIGRYPTLDILPSGAVPANPTELLNCPLLGKLINQVRQSYDYIMIDTPAASNLADAEIFARHSDHKLHIIRAGKFKRSNLDELKEQEGVEPNQFVILNGVSLNSLYGESYN